jgi:hypothetical protein
MIKYKDFVPKVLERGPFGGATAIESFDDVVQAANDWITNHSIQIVNIETMIWPEFQEMDLPKVEHIRVWYRESQ